MKLSEIQEILAAEVLCVEERLDTEASAAFGCDLLSDSLVLATPGCVLVTGLASVQAIRTATMIEASAVVFVRGKNPGEDAVELARRNGLPVMRTSKLLFDSCGLLYQAGLRAQPER